MTRLLVVTLARHTARGKEGEEERTPSVQGEVGRQQREARPEATRGQESLLCSQQSADQPHLGGLGPKLTPRLYHEGTQDSGVSRAPVFLGSDTPKCQTFLSLCTVKN